MVAVFTGSGLGLFNTSLTQLGVSSGGWSGVGQPRGGHSVNLATGNLLLQSLDESLLVRGLSATLLRTYNSRGTVSGVGQDGWLTGFERNVTLSGTLNAAGSTMTLSTGDGQGVVFVYSGTANRYTTTGGDGAHDTLVWSSAALTWTYTEGSSRREELYADHASATLKGRLTRIRDLKSDGTTPAQYDIVYDASQRISEVRSIDGAAAASRDAIVFAYNGATTQLVSISTREGGVLMSQVSYGYDAAGRLAWVQTDLTPEISTDNVWDATTAVNNDGKRFRTSYTYVSGTASDLRIASVSTSDGVTVAYSYEADGSGGFRVKTVTQGDAGDSSTQTTSFTYNAGSTDVVDGAGRTWTYEYDASKQLTGVLEPAVNGLRQKTSYTYDTSGNVTRMTQAPSAGGVAALDTVFRYDANGNRTLQRDLQGNTVEWTYDATTQQVLTEKRYTVADADGLDATHVGTTNLPSGVLTTRYVYDSRARVRFVVNAAGEVTEFSYATSGNGIGQVASERRYIGAIYTSTTVTEAALNTWATDAAALRKSNSALSTYSYNSKGRLSQSAQYATVTADVNGTGVLDAATGLTHLSYDAQGLLRQRITVHGASRSVAGVAPSSSEVTDYLYDGMGRLLSVLSRDIATTAMPDARIDPTGYAAWVTANDATTVLSTYAYVDSANQIKLTTDTGLVRTEARNRAGMLLSSSEVGTVSGSAVTRTTQFYYDNSGRLRASEDAAGARSYVFYDNAGRMTATVDGTGAVVQTVYDGVGRVVQQVAYATRVDTTTWLSAGAVTRSELVFAATAPALTGTQAWVQSSATNDRTTSRSYDTAGRMLTETVLGVDASQTQTTTYSYDAAHRLIQRRVTDGANTTATARTTRYLYDAADRQVATIDALNDVTETVYDFAGRVVKTIRYANVSGSPAATTLSTLRPTTHANDQSTRIFYDGRGQQTGVLDAEGYLTESVYDEAQNQRAVKAYAKRLTGLTGSETLSGLRTSALAGLQPGDPGYRLTQRSFNGLGQLITELNHAGTVTRYTYDEAGRVVNTRTDNETTEIREGTLRYDVFGNLIGELGGVGSQSAQIVAGMTEAQLDALYAQYGVRHSYDVLGRRIERVDAAGNKTWYSYDTQGRQTFVVRGVHDSGNVPNAQGEVTETRYDAFGQVIDSIAYTGRITIAVPGSRASVQTAITALIALGVNGTTDSRVQFGYDRRGLLSQRTDAQGYRSTYTYSAFGEGVTQQDWALDNSLRRTLTSTYDKRGQRTTLLEAGGSLSRSQGSSFDAFGRALTRTDARGVVSTASYDRLGRQVGQSMDLGGGRIESASTSYDAYSRVVTQTDAVGKVTTYAYSDTNRTMTVTSPEGVVITTAYNRSGQTLEVRQPLPGGATAVSSVSYDRDGHVLTQTDALNTITTHTYDARQLLTTTTDASGRKVEYRYDAIGRVLQRIEDPGAGKLNLTTTTVYDGQGRQVQVTDASGRVTAMVYDRRGQLTETTRDPSGLALKTSYSWDGDGRQLTVTEGAGSATATTTAYGYDALGRRISQTRASGVLNLTTSYEYDANDNVTRSIDASGRIVRYSYDAANRMRFSIDGASGVTEVVYDKAGRATMTRRYVKALDASTLGIAPTEAQVSGLVSAQALANDALDEVTYRLYDGDGRVRLSLDGTGGVSETVYDVAGRVARQTRYAQTVVMTTALRNALAAGTATVASVGAVTNAADESVRYVYDAAGQVRYRIDGTGAYRAVWYDAAGRVSVTRSMTQRLNMAGISDGMTVAQIDAMNLWGASDDLEMFVYDAAGRQRYVLQAVGDPTVFPFTAAVTQRTYDGADRVLSTGGYVALMTLDAALIAKLGAGTAVESDFATFVAANASTAQSQRTVYDAAGRATYSIDATGAFTRNWYDALDRIVAVRKFAVSLPAALLTDAATVAVLDGQFGPIGAWSAAYQHEYRVYDAAGRLLITYDALGQVTQTDYDGAGRATITRRFAVPFSSADPNLGNKLFAGTATIADFATFTAANESTARAQAMVYDATGQLRFSLSRDGGQWLIDERQYDGVGRVTASVRYGFGVVYTPGQSEAQVIVAIQAQLSPMPAVLATQTRSTRFVYDAANRQRFVMDASGALSEQRYDGAGRVVETRSYGNLPVGIALTEAALLAWGQGQASADVRKVSHSYDAAGQLTARTDALNHSEFFSYDGAGRMLTRTDRVGAVWTYQYDAAGRRTTEISPASDVFGITALGVLSASNRSIVTRYVYDALGQLTRKTEDADNATVAERRITEYVYDTRGNRIKTILPHPGAIDPVTGNRVFNGPNPTIETTFNALGQAVVQKDERGYYRYTAYDAQGLVSAEVDQAGHVTLYAYNPYGEQTQLLRYAAVLATTASALTSVNWQAGQAMTGGQMFAGIDNNNVDNRAIYTAYDGLGRKTQVTLKAVQYYTAAGALLNGSPTTQFVYNAYGDAVKESVLLEGTAGQGDAVWSHTWRYFDAAGRNTVTVDAEGYVTALTYNVTGEVVKTVEYARAIATSGLTTQTSPALPGAGDPITGDDREMRWSYDVLGRKASQTVVRNVRNTDGSSAQYDDVTAYGYDFEDRVTTITDNTGTITTTYNALGQRAAVREQARSVLVGNIEDVLYVSTANDLTSAIAYTQRSPYTTIVYDGLGRMIASRRHANGHDAVNTPAVDNARDQVDLTFYDQLDRVLMVQSAAGWTSATPTAHRTWSEYDAAGNLTHRWSSLDAADSSRNAMVHRWYSYDAVGRQTGASQTRALVATGAQLGIDQSEAVIYNAFGEIVSKTYGGLAGTLQYSYDAVGRLYADNSTGATRNYGYNLAGHQVRESHKTWIDSSTGAVDTVTRTQTDRLGRAIAITLPSHTTDAGTSSLVRQTYDRWGNTVQVIDGRGYQTDYVYNDHNQLIRETRPLVWVVGENGAGSWQRPVNEWYYGAAGRLRGTRDANGHLRTYEYDAVGHQVSSTDALGNVTRMAFDVLGNHRYTQDALGYLTFKDYDLLNRVVAIGDRLVSGNGVNRDRTTLQSYQLNQHGDRVRVTNALNYIAKYDYDSQQRLLRSETSMGVIQHTAYDVQGHKTSETNALSELTPSYDDRDVGALVRLNAMSWQYDVFGRVIDHNNLSGRDSDYTYDAQSGMLTGESASGGVGVLDSNGQPMGDAGKTIRYTRSGRVREIVEAGGGTYRYAYDAAGNRTLEESDATDRYGVRMHTITRTTYDSNNRMQRVVQDEVDGNGATQKRVFDLGYDYDANGNRRRVVTQSGYGPNVTGIAIPLNAAPVVVMSPADRTFRTGTSGAFRLLFSDVFRDAQNDALTLTITQGNGSALPSWLVATRDAQTGEIVFTGTVPAGAADADVVVKLTATETLNAANTVNSSFTVRVRSNTTPAASTATTTFNAVVGKPFGRDLLAGVYFVDPDVGDSLSLSVVGTVPSWLTVNTSKPGVASLTGTPPSAGSYVITLRATDGQGAVFDRTVTVTAAANAAPTVVAVPVAQYATAGRAFDWVKPLAQVFADGNGDTLQVTAVGVPPWLVFQQIGGAAPELRLNGQVPPNEVDGRLYTVTLTATDPSGAQVSTTLQLEVTTNIAPVATQVTDKTAYQGQAFTSVVLPTFYDENGDGLTYSLTGLPPGMSFNATTRVLSGTPTVAGSWTVSYGANDGRVTVSTPFTMTVVANNAPVAPTVGSQTGTRTSPVYLALPAFTDANGDTLTYSVSNLPAGLSFNPSTRVISGTPTTAGSWTVTYAANDGRGGVASTTFAYTINEPASNLPPVVSNPLADQVLSGGAGFSIPLPANSFTDPEGLGLTYTYAVIAGPSAANWLMFTPGTRTFSNAPGLVAPSLWGAGWTVRVTVTDTIGQQVYDDFTLEIEEEPGGGGGGGNELESTAPPTESALSFEMGASSQTEVLASATTSAVTVAPLDQWFSYDAENRLKVVNGVLSGGTIEVSTGNADSYALMYDGGGQAVGRIQRASVNSVTQTQVTLSSYDLRGNRLYEFHMQVLGGAYAGIAKEFIVDAAGQTLGTRTHYALGTTRQTYVSPIDIQEGLSSETIDIGGWLSDAQTMQYDGDGRVLTQSAYRRIGQWAQPGSGNEYSDITQLRLQNRVDYTQADGGNAWEDTDLSNNLSGYDAAGRLIKYRYSARNPDGPDWYTHTFTSSYEGWNRWQEKTVAGISTNNSFKPTTNTLTLDAYGRITQQREATVGASIDDRVRVYTYSGDGMVQTRREGTLNGSNVFTQSTRAPNDTPQTFQFVHAAGQQLAELQAGGEVRTTLPTGGSRFSQQTAQAIYTASGAGRQTNTLSRMIGNSGPYTAGGGMATVLEGETLHSLAQRVYGTSTLWYVLADANGLSDAGAPLTAGTQLNTPSVGVNSNDANTFKPYNPNEAIGATSPSLPFIPPPAGGCNTLALILIVIVIIVVSIVTWGAATGPMTGAATAGATTAGAAGAAAGTTISTGLAAATVTTAATATTAATVGAASLTFAGGMVAGAAAGAAGALAGQVVGSALGVSSFSWRNVAAGAITGAITGGLANVGGLGGVSGAVTNSHYGAAAALAVGNGLGGYAGQKIAGLKPAFSWKSIAASAVASVVGAKIGPAISRGMGEFGQDFTAGLVGGVSGYAARKAFGFNEKFDLASITADALGSAIGSAAGRGALASRRGSNLKSGIVGKSDLTKSSGGLDLSRVMAAELGNRSGNGAVYDDGTSPGAMRIGNFAFSDERDALDAEGRAIERDVLAATTPEELVATRRRLDAWHLKYDAAQGLPHTQPATHGSSDDGYTYAHDSNVVELERTEVTATPRSNPMTAEQWAGVMASVGLGKPMPSPINLSGIVFSEPPLSTRGQVYAQQLAGGRQMIDADPATASQYAMQRVANDVGVLGANSFAGGAYGVAAAAGATHAQSMRAAVITGDTTNVVIAGASIYGAVKMRSQGPTTLVDINGGTRTIYSGPAAQASQPYRINSGGYSVESVRYTSDAGGVTQVRGWSPTQNIRVSTATELTPRIDLASAFKVKGYRNGSFNFDYRYPDTHGLAATISADKKIGMDGILGFEIKAGGDVARLGSGKDMFYSMMKRAGAEGVAVNGIRGYWIGGANSTNYSMYRSAISEGMTAEQAALRTWTGQRAAEYGFTHVTRVEDTGRSVKAWFVRPPGG